MPRSALASALGRLSLVLAAGLSLACSPPRVERVVLVTIDTLRADHVGAYGATKARTPTLDGLAATGVRFEHAISPAPITLPSHTSILTALDPPHHGVRDNSTFRLAESIPTLAERMKAGGFATGAFVGAFVLDASFGLARGFDVYDDEMTESDAGVKDSFSERPASAVVDAALAWLGKAPERFFLWVHLYDPHAVYRPPLGWRLALPGDPYAGEIAFADAEVGRLLAGVRDRFGETPERGATLVVVTSDHGESLGEHGEPTHSCTIYDATQRVPLIVAGPGLPAARVVTAPVRLVDVAPTILARTGLAALENVQGTDLTPLVEGRETGPRRAHVETLATQLTFGWSPLLGVRTERWKWIRAPRPELYDLAADPGETKNLIAEHPGVARELDAALDAHLASARGGATTLAPSPEERARLESLGYVVGSPESLGESLGVVGGLDPKDWIARTLEAVARAQLLLDAAMPRRALAELEGLEGGGAFLAGIRSRAALQSGDAKRAENEARGVLASCKSCDGAWIDLAAALAAQSRFDEGREAGAEAARLSPRSAAPLVALGALEEKAGRREEAERRYTEALSQAQRSGEAAWRLAALQLEAGRLDEADALLAKTAARDLQEREAVLRLAGAEAKAGRRDAALERLRTANLRNARDAEIALALARLALDAGQPDVARGALDAARDAEATPETRAAMDALSRRAGAGSDAATRGTR